MSTTVPIVVMGVAGCGKTTIGELLVGRLEVPYAEADDHHPPSNVEKMAHGIPLSDQDRAPWLAAIAHRIATAGTDGGLVISCSGLKRRYRDVLRRADPQTWFVHLVIDQALAAERVAGRAAHFMPTSLLASQFEALEPLQADENGVRVDAAQPPEQIITTVLSQLPITLPTAVSRSCREAEDGEGAVDVAAGPAGGFGDVGASGQAEGASKAYLREQCVLETTDAVL